MAGRVLVSSPGPVVEITLSNPDRRNALDPGMCRALADAVAGLAGAGVRAAVLAGDPAGRAFCAGFDLAALEQAGQGAAPTGADDLFESMMLAVGECPVPLVAALDGPTMGGGCELAAACDLRVAHAAVKLGLPPARLGIVYAPRGLARLSAICGESRARRLFLTAEIVDAATAAAWGLVDELVTEAEVRPRARALAESIAALAPQAVQGMRVSFEALLRRRAALEGSDATEVARRRSAAWHSRDAAEGRAAASEKRPPKFTGQ